MKTSDNSLVVDIKTMNSSSSLIELSKRHDKLFYSIVRKFFKPASEQFKEVEENFLQILFDSVRSFNADKNSKFSTWFANQTKYFCLNLKNKEKNVLVFDDPKTLEFLIETSQKNKPVDSTDFLTTMVKDFTSQLRDENMRKVIQYRYFERDKVMTYHEIAKKLNITAQTALNWHNKFISYAKKKLKNKKYLA